MQTFSLQSGSNGNAIYVEANGVRLLFDAGISGKMAQRRMAAHDRDMCDLDAVIISHDHSDHVRCAGIYQRKFAVPVYMTHDTHKTATSWSNLGKMTDLRHFQSGDSLSFGAVVVHTVPTAHDAADGVAFVVECEGKRLGILTDLGHPFQELGRVLASVDAAYLESNYDPTMLADGSYPPRLKARIAGPGGHLSNNETASLVQACGRERPAWIAVAHLSEMNNHPELALATVRQAVGRQYPVYHAPRYECSELLTL